MGSSPCLVYVVEDNREHRTLLHEIMEPAGVRARSFASSEEFLAVYDRLSPGPILLDLRLPGMGGASMIEELVRRGCSWPVIILTAHPNAAEVERVRRAGAANILCKPVKGAVILATLEDACRRLAAAWLDKPNPDIHGRFAMLTPGERAVLDGLRERLSIKEIAGRCAISDRAARARLQKMLRKMQASSREHLLQLATAAGMPVKPPKARV